MSRLFTAIDLPAEQRDRLAALCKGIDGAKWVKPEQIHLTLRFIGETDDETTQLLQAALEEIAPPSLTLQISGAGTFPPSPKPPRVLWIAVENNPALHALQRQIEAAAQDCGFPREKRPWSPHITLARFKKPPGKDLQRWLTANAKAKPQSFKVTEFRLYQCELSSKGAVHEVLQAFPMHAER